MKFLVLIKFRVLMKSKPGFRFPYFIEMANILDINFNINKTDTIELYGDYFRIDQIVKSLTDNVHMLRLKEQKNEGHIVTFPREIIPIFKNIRKEWEDLKFYINDYYLGKKLISFEELCT